MVIVVTLSNFQVRWRPSCFFDQISFDQPPTTYFRMKIKQPKLLSQLADLVSLPVTMIKVSLILATPSLPYAAHYKSRRRY